MNARKIMPHEQAVELLPWLVNGSMGEEEREKVRQHAHSCVVCKRELQALELINAFIADAAKSEPTLSPDMRRINARIDELIERRGRMRGWVSRLGVALHDPWRLAFAVQSVLVIGLAVALLWPNAQEAEFTTLTQAKELPAGHHVRVVFNPDMAVADLAALLEELSLTVADGPSARGVYTLAVSETLSQDARAQVLASLQRNPDVQFAQWAVHGEN